MALIVDTNVFIHAERKRIDLAELIGAMRDFTGESRLGISVITLTELAHGQERAGYPSLSARRGMLVSDLMESMTAYEVDTEIVIRAGRLDGLLEGNGFTIGFPDLLIAATAVENGFGVFTSNLRHFEAVPHLRVVSAAEFTR